MNVNALGSGAIQRDCENFENQMERRTKQTDF